MIEGGDADIFEQEGGQQEVLIVGIRVERRTGGDDTGGLRRDAERAGRGATEIDRGHCHRRRAELRAQERDVRRFVGRNFTRILRDERIGKADLTTGRDRPLRRGAGAAGGQQRVRQPCASYGIAVELRLEIFEVEREIENGGIGDRLRRGARRERYRSRADRRDRARPERSAKEFAAFVTALDACIELRNQRVARIPGFNHSIGHCAEPFCFKRFVIPERVAPTGRRRKPGCGGSLPFRVVHLAPPSKVNAV